MVDLIVMGKSTRVSILVCALIAFAGAANGAVTTFPKTFHAQNVATNGTTLYVRVGGTGPAVVLLHGFGDTGDMWAPLAEKLAADHTVIVPDLRGMGLSAHPNAGYTKKNQARDIAGVMDALHVEKADLVTHDIGDMVGYALAVQFPKKITKWAVIDAPLPGIGKWNEILLSPMLWRFNFRGPDEERLVAGRDATDNKDFLAKNGKLDVPVLAVGAEKSFGLQEAEDLRFVADNVQAAIVPHSGHWIMDENPDATIRLVAGFLEKQ
ncbi:MAG TPA: alpha/beta hydrolase [Rhizomicrobium sp.]|jgi:pimeloyl-ACP methyl ester carboxylesterase